MDSLLQKYSARLQLTSLDKKLERIPDSPPKQNIPIIEFPNHILEKINYICHTRSATSSKSTLSMHQLNLLFEQLFYCQLSNWIKENYHHEMARSPWFYSLVPLELLQIVPESRFQSPITMKIYTTKTPPIDFSIPEHRALLPPSALKVKLHTCLNEMKNISHIVAADYENRNILLKKRLESFADSSFKLPILIPAFPETVLEAINYVFLRHYATSAEHSITCEQFFSTFREVFQFTFPEMMNTLFGNAKAIKVAWYFSLFTIPFLEIRANSRLNNPNRLYLFTNLSGKNEGGEFVNIEPAADLQGKEEIEAKAETEIAFIRQNVEGSSFEDGGEDRNELTFRNDDEAGLLVNDHILQESSLDSKVTDKSIRADSTEDLENIDEIDNQDPDVKDLFAQQKDLYFQKKGQKRKMGFANLALPLTRKRQSFGSNDEPPLIRRSSSIEEQELAIEPSQLIPISAEFHKILDNASIIVDGKQIRDISTIRSYVSKHIGQMDLEDIVKIFELCSPLAGAASSSSSKLRSPTASDGVLADIVKIDDLVKVRALADRMCKIVKANAEIEDPTSPVSPSNNDYIISEPVLIKLFEGLKKLEPKIHPDHKEIMRALCYILSKTRKQVLSSTAVTSCFENLRTFEKSVEMLNVYRVLGETIVSASKRKGDGPFFTREQYYKIIFSLKEIEPLDSSIGKLLQTINDGLGIKKYLSSNSISADPIDDIKKLRAGGRYIARGIIKLMQSITDSFSAEKIDSLYNVADYLAYLIEATEPMSTTTFARSQKDDEEMLTYLLDILRDQRTDDHRIRHLMHATYVFGKGTGGVVNEKVCEALVRALIHQSNYSSDYVEVEEYLELLIVLLSHSRVKYSASLISLTRKRSTANFVYSFRGLSSTSTTVRRFMIALAESKLITNNLLQQVSLESESMELEADSKLNSERGHHRRRMDEVLKICKGLIGMRKKLPLPSSWNEVEERETFTVLITQLMLVPFHHCSGLLSDSTLRKFFLELIRCYSKIREYVGQEEDPVCLFIKEEVIRYFARVSQTDQENGHHEFGEVADEKGNVNKNRLEVFEACTEILSLLLGCESDCDVLDRQLVSAMNYILAAHFPAHGIREEIAIPSESKKKSFLQSLLFLASAIRSLSSVILVTELSALSNYVLGLLKTIPMSYYLEGLTNNLRGTAMRAIRLLYEGLSPIIASQNSLLSDGMEAVLLLQSLLHQVCIDRILIQQEVEENKGTSGVLNPQQMRKSINFSKEFLQLFCHYHSLNFLLRSLAEKQSPQFITDFETVITKTFNEVDDLQVLSNVFTITAKTSLLLPSRDIADPSTSSAVVTGDVLRCCPFLFALTRSDEIFRSHEHYQLLLKILFDKNRFIRTTKDYELLKEELKPWAIKHKAKEHHASEHPQHSSLAEQAVDFLFHLSHLFHNYSIDAKQGVPTSTSAAQIFNNNRHCNVISMVLQIIVAFLPSNSNDTTASKWLTPCLLWKLFKSVRYLEAGKMELSSTTRYKPKRFDLIPFLRHQLLLYSTKLLFTSFQYYQNEKPSQPQTASSSLSSTLRGEGTSATRKSKYLEELLSTDYLLLYQECHLSYDFALEIKEMMRKSNPTFHIHFGSVMAALFVLPYEEIKQSLTTLKNEVYDAFIYYRTMPILPSLSVSNSVTARSKLWRKAEEYCIEQLQYRLAAAARQSPLKKDTQSERLLISCVIRSFESRIAINLHEFAPFIRRSNRSSKEDCLDFSDDERLAGEIIIFGQDCKWQNAHYLLLDIIPSYFNRIAENTSLSKHCCSRHDSDRINKLFEVAEGLLVIRLDFLANLSAETLVFDSLDNHFSLAKGHATRDNYEDVLEKRIDVLVERFLQILCTISSQVTHEQG